jgi:UDP-3-O-[3-hydroxymyristoyl] glucosamine N-acyltransferase
MVTRTLAELAELCQARLLGDGAKPIVGPASLEDASGDEISFLAHPRYAGLLETTRAGAVVVGEGVRAGRRDLALLECRDPGRAFSDVVLAFARVPSAPPPGVHATAVVERGAEVAATASVGPHVVIGAGARVGERAVLHASVVIGANVTVEEHSVLHPRVVVYHDVTIGARCIVHAGAVIGSDGFGFEPTAQGWAKIPQCGTVEIGDDVEIGANATIDRGRFGPTRIASAVKIDNLVHVAHNVQIGAGALLVAQVGVAGSTRIGERAILAGQAGISGHLTIGPGARVGGGSAVFKDVPAGSDVFGNPAGPKQESLRQAQRVKRLGRWWDELQSLRERVRRLEERG